MSLLKSVLRRRGFDSRIYYASLRFAQTIGNVLYHDIAFGWPRTTALVGEWLFSHALDDRQAKHGAHYIETTLKPCEPDFVDAILSVHRRVDAFVDACVRDILDNRPRFVGFTSSFQQHVPSLAVAKRLKAVAPDVTVAFGGANCEGTMGLETLRRFAFVDVVVSGEAESIISELVERVMRGEAVDDLPGVYTSTSDLARTDVANAPLVRDLDGLPFPDYSDYFCEVGEPISEVVRLPFETSRGCWWGERSHCTFCGLNGATMRYRSKSAARSIAEIEHLASTYGVRKLSATDNILDMRYFRTLLPQLARSDLGLELFYEVKANLKREHLRALRDAGVMTIQPGIESLSSPVLQLMQKGVTSLQNIRLLKWCSAYNIEPKWNFLYGFPDEAAPDYRAVAELLPLLSHLQPPEYVGSLRLDRFSPYFDRPELYGISDVEPYPAYAHAYALPPEALKRLAYYFTFRYRDGRESHADVRALEATIAAWKTAHAESDLVLLDDGMTALVLDYRAVAMAPLTILSDFERAIYIACDDIRSVEQLRTIALVDSSVKNRVNEIPGILERFIDQKIMLREGSNFLSLAVAIDGRVSAAMGARFASAAVALA